MNSSVNFLFEVRVIHRGHVLTSLAIFGPKVEALATTELMIV
jgi:hypothetical protein